MARTSPPHPQGFYAVRSGRRGGVRRCVFLFWEDAQQFVDDDDVDGDDDENGDGTPCAFFPTMDGAVAWLLGDDHHRADADSGAEAEAEADEKSDGSDADADAGKKKRRGTKRGRPGRSPRCEPEGSDEESDEELDYEPERWAKRMKQLRRYRANFGACNVPKDYPVIGRWAQRQRNAYLRTYGKTKAKQTEAEAAAAAEAAGEVLETTETGEKEFYKEPLQYDKVLELRELGFDFDVRNVTTLESVVRGTPRGQRKKRSTEDVEKVKEWERMFEKYRNRTPGPLNQDVNRWVRKQKLQYANLVEGKASRLSHGDRLRRLQDVGFNFESRANKSFEESLQDFVEHMRGKGPNTPFEGKLHGWVKSMRTAAHAYRGGRKSSLTPEKMRMLEEAGFQFRTKMPCMEEMIPWDERFEEILVYKEEHGHMRVPKREPGGLGMWCFNQRQEYRLTSTGKRKLTAERAAKNQRLAEAGFEWSLK